MRSGEPARPFNFYRLLDLKCYFRRNSFFHIHNVFVRKIKRLFVTNSYVLLDKGVSQISEGTRKPI